MQSRHSSNSLPPHVRCVGVLAPASAADVIKLGVAGPHSGDLALRPAEQDAAEMVVAEVNAAGGISGKKVELMMVDDQCKPRSPPTSRPSWFPEGVNIVIGHVCSGATKAAMGIYKDAKIIAISPSATNPPLTKGGEYPELLSHHRSGRRSGRCSPAFATDKLNAKKIAIIHDKGDYGKGLRRLLPRKPSKGRQGQGRHV